MTAQKGKDLLLKVDDGGGAFAAVAGLRSNKLAFNAQAIDVTDANSAGRWRDSSASAACSTLPFPARASSRTPPATR